MLSPNTLKYLFILASSLLVGWAQASEADSAHKSTVVPHQISVGVDVVRPALSINNTAAQGLEFMVDYYRGRELYWVAEGGVGASAVRYTDLSYDANSYFLRLGMNKMLFQRSKPNDWGGALMGVRLAASHVQRSRAQYTVLDSLWGNSQGTVDKAQLYGVWMELNGGVRVEVAPRILLGWTARAKFLLNNKSINELAPLYMAGYGRADKNVAFDLNFYVAYAFRRK
jgi:hypothetical protein